MTVDRTPEDRAASDDLAPCGRVWKFGDDIDTDVLAPGAYMKGSIENLAAHTLESVDAAFAAEVAPGDIIVAGRNFGTGSSREQAAQVLRVRGVGAVLAQSFAGIFYRNALNLGLLVLTSDHLDGIDARDRISIDVAAGSILNLTKNTTHACETLPDHLVGIVRAGGLLPYLEKQSRMAR